MDLQEPSVGTSWRRWFLHLASSQKVGMVVLLLLLLGVLYSFAALDMRFFLVPSGSMEPTLNPGDMVVTLSQREYRRGDIVVWADNGDYLVKRIVGLPGDRVSVVDGALFLNGKYASEPYLLEAMNYYIETPVAIPEGFYFYLGDNRNASDDSSLGFITVGSGSAPRDPRAWLGDLNAIIGKVVFRYYPYSRFGPVPSYPLINVAGQ